MKKLLTMILLITSVSFKVHAQDSIKFIPVFYKQCNTDLIKVTNLNFYIAYNEYHDVSNNITQTTVAIYHSAVKVRNTYNKVPEVIKLPATVTQIDLNVNEFATINVDVDSDGIWRDTFYLQNEERYYKAPQEIYTECNEVSNGVITRYNLLGNITEMVEYDSGTLISEVAFNKDGDTISVRKNITYFDSTYLVRKYNSEGTLIYYQDHKQTRFYNRDGTLLVELYHPLLTKKQIKTYRKKVTSRDYKKIQIKGTNPKVATHQLQPCMVKVYYPDGKIKLEAEYLVSMSLLCEFSDRNFAQLLAYDDDKWWYRVITIKRILYDKQGGFIVNE